MRFFGIVSALFALSSAVTCSPVKLESTGIITGSKGVHPEYLMWLSDIGYKWQTHFTFQLAYNPVDCYYGALTVCVNKYPDLVCSAGYMSHGGTGDNRFSEWHFKGDFYDVTVRLVHKADGEVTSWTIEHGALGNHNIKYVSLTNLQSHIVIPYFD